MMAAIFWDSYGVVCVDYLDKGITINGEYWAELLRRLNQKIKNERPHLAKKKILYRDNTPTHSSTVVIMKLHELKYELIPHTSHSPDLARYDFFLFSMLKK